MVSPQPSAALGKLFPAGVVATELRQPSLLRAQALLSEQSLLTSEEWACIMHCHGRRIQDFAGGRLCAHYALGAFGMADVSILPGSDREPLWPAGFTGSITHTEGYSAAVVGRIEQVGSNRCSGATSVRRGNSISSCSVRRAAGAGWRR